MSESVDQIVAVNGLSDLAKDCKTEFSRLQECLSTDQEPVAQLPLRLPQVRDEAKRFQQWLGATGALHNVGDMNSLDGRLGHADHVRSAILDTLKRLWSAVPIGMLL